MTSHHISLTLSPMGANAESFFIELLSPHPYGPPKDVNPEDFFFKYHVSVYQKVVLQP